MVAEYTVKRNGKWYHAGEKIDEAVKPLRYLLMAKRLPKLKLTE